VEQFDEAELLHIYAACSTLAETFNKERIETKGMDYRNQTYLRERVITLDSIASKAHRMRECLKSERKV
jgi:hypothetical protein